MRIKSNNLSNEERTKTLEALYTAVSSVKGRDGMKLFMRDLLTESERIMLGRRILVARALLTGQTYNQIVDEYNVGKDTILKISKWLNDQLPGYEVAVEGLERELANNKQNKEKKQLYATTALYRLKKKFPLHFLLFPNQKK